MRATRRLKTINETIVRIMQGDLQERLPTHGKMDDLNYVASAVNLMLDEIVRLLNQLKSVGDNIAHDLRVRSRLCTPSNVVSRDNPIRTYASRPNGRSATLTMRLPPSPPFNIGD